MSYKTIVGQNNYSEDEFDRLAYSVDASQITGTAKAVIWPVSADQIHRIILQANRTGDNLVFRGGGTGLAGAVVPQDSIIIDLSRMRRIMHLNRTEKWVSVEPGVNVDNLNKELAKQGLFFPVIPASHKVCLIGGMIATNAAGERALRFGKMCDWVKSLKVLDGTGKLYELDAPNDFIGTEGIIGVVIEAKLKLTEPLKPMSVDFEYYADIDSLLEGVQKLGESRSIVAMEFFDPHCAKLIDKKPGYYLFIEYEDETGKITSQMDMKNLWHERECLGPLLTSNGNSLMEDPKVPSERMGELLQWLYDHNVPVFGHIGYGIVHPRFKPNDKQIIDEMFTLVNKLGGNVSGEHGIGISKRKYIDPELKKRLIKVKAKYDPNNILNRGKVL